MTFYQNRREAVRDARIAIWGEGTVNQRPFLHLEVQDPIFLLGTYVTARVNKRDILIKFDNYGREKVTPL